MKHQHINRQQLQRPQVDFGQPCDLLFAKILFMINLVSGIAAGKLFIAADDYRQIPSFVPSIYRFLVFYGFHYYFNVEHLSNM
jgi:hypothetical protein